jgi:hypothetical protein
VRGGGEPLDLPARAAARRSDLGGLATGADRDLKLAHRRVERAGAIERLARRLDVGRRQRVRDVHQRPGQPPQQRLDPPQHQPHRIDRHDRVRHQRHAAADQRVDEPLAGERALRHLQRRDEHRRDRRLVDEQHAPSGQHGNGHRKRDDDHQLPRPRPGRDHDQVGHADSERHPERQLPGPRAAPLDRQPQRHDHRDRREERLLAVQQLGRDEPGDAGRDRRQQDARCGDAQGDHARLQGRLEVRALQGADSDLRSG